MKKKKNKPTKKQARSEQAKRRRDQERRKRQQTVRQREEQLAREMQPLVSQYNLDDEEQFYQFAAQVMQDSADLYDEPEFDDWTFSPADAMHTLLLMFNRYVPTPPELEKLSEEKREEVMSEASIYAVTEFVTPELQQDLLKTLEQCRKRLKDEGEKDLAALAAATEWLLRGDMRREIWGTCGILHAIFQDALETAGELEEAKEEALKRAQAHQPDAEEIGDLEEGTPAHDAFWDAVEDDPDLLDYIERQIELEESLEEAMYEVEAELLEELVEPEEIDGLFEGLVQALHASDIDPVEIKQLPTNERAQHHQALQSHISEMIHARLDADRFRDVMTDLQEIAEEEDELDPVVHLARSLHNALAQADTPYWENTSFRQFLLSALLGLSARNLDQDDDEDDEAA